jgi:hypothetical protein
MSRYRTLWGVYHADGGALGELKYLLGKLTGEAHCALCDITHGSLTKKPAFRVLERELGVPLRLVHLNEQPEALATATNGRTPCVVGEADAGFRLLLGPSNLEDCHGSVDRFRQALERAL